MSADIASVSGGAPVSVVVGEDNASTDRLRPGAGLVFALLVLATVAAFAWSQRLKRDPLVIDRVTFVDVHPAHRRRAFTPNGDCRFDREPDPLPHHPVRPGHRPGGEARRQADRHPRPRHLLKRYRFHTFYWDGRSAE